MIMLGTARLLRSVGLALLPSFALLVLLQPAQAQVPVPTLPTNPSQAQPANPEDLNNLRPLSQDGSALSFLTSTKN